MPPGAHVASKSTSAGIIDHLLFAFFIFAFPYNEVTLIPHRLSRLQAGCRASFAEMLDGALAGDEAVQIARLVPSR
jgi:hypothetical protein